MSWNIPPPDMPLVYWSPSRDALVRQVSPAATAWVWDGEMTTFEVEPPADAVRLGPVQTSELEQIKQRARRVIEIHGPNSKWAHAARLILGDETDHQNDRAREIRETCGLHPRDVRALEGRTWSTTKPGLTVWKDET